MKKFLEFVYEQTAPPPAPAPAPTAAPAQPSVPPVQPPAQPSAQSGTTQAQQPAQPQPQQGAQEQKSGDLSNYNNETTKFPDTVKKMVDLIRDLDKEQLIKVRNLIAELKGMGNGKDEIGKL